MMTMIDKNWMIDLYYQYLDNLRIQLMKIINQDNCFLTNQNIIGDTWHQSSRVRNTRGPPSAHQ